MKRIIGSGWLCAALWILCSAPASAQGSSETREEFWPEVDVFVHLNPKVRLMFLGTVTRARETRETIEGQVGAHVDYLLHPRVSFRAGYRHGFAIGDSQDPFSEHRMLFEQTFRFPLPVGLLLSDRNREDLRWVDGEFSVRYRNRLRLERGFTVWERGLTPYATGELYYDSRFDTWNRNRYAFGLEVSLKHRGPLTSLISPRKNMVLDLYFMRQNDSRSQPRHVNTIGLVVNLYF